MLLLTVKSILSEMTVKSILSDMISLSHLVLIIAFTIPPLFVFTLVIDAWAYLSGSVCFRQISSNVYLFVGQAEEKRMIYFTQPSLLLPVNFNAEYDRYEAYENCW